jgi:hypothetical protein
MAESFDLPGTETPSKYVVLFSIKEEQQHSDTRYASVVSCNSPKEPNRSRTNPSVPSYRNSRLVSEEQKQANRNKSKVRARVEHVFGAQATMDGHLVLRHRPTASKG